MGADTHLRPTAPDGAGVVVSMLGSLEVWVGDEPLRLRGAKQRGVLGALALHADQVVSTGELVTAVWGEVDDPRVEHSLQQHISSLRKALEPQRRTGDEPLVLRTQAPGYVLHTGSVDVKDFERDMTTGQRAAEAGQWHDAVAQLERAEAHWRGPALADLRASDWFEAAAVRLEQRRLAAREIRTDALLALGRHAEVIPEVEFMLAAHPYRERSWGQLMLALYRSGRQADALAAYQRARQILADDLGLDPSRALRELESAILAQDASLEGSTPPVAPDEDVHATYRGDEVDAAALLVLPDGQSVILPPGTTTLIGRSSEARLRLTDSRSSRRHATVESSAAGHVLRDLGSTNGTFVNGEQVTEHHLRAGDVVGVGGADGAQLRFVVPRR